MGGRALSFFWWMCATRFSKCRVYRGEFSLKNGGLGNENLEKFWSRELEFLPKHGWKSKKNSTNWKRGGAQERRMDGNLVGYRERRLAWKKGVMTAVHSHRALPLSMWVPSRTTLPPLRSRKPSKETHLFLWISALLPHGCLFWCCLFCRFASCSDYHV